MMNENKIKSVVNEIRNFLEAAVGDIASSVIEFPDMLEGNMKKKYKLAQKSGCRDLVGYMADEYYNDVDCIQDLIGDRIYDFVNGNREDYNKVCEELVKSSHKALSKAANHLLKE
jgi:hypothetical protein